MAFTSRGKMHKAIRNGDRKTVERVLERGYDVNDMSFGGVCPLLLAVFEGKTEIAELLISKGADFSSQYHNDVLTGGHWATLLHVAAGRGHADIVTLLLERDKYDHALRNKPDGQHNTALHLAAAGGHAAVVAILLDNGFDPAIKGANQKLAVGYAYGSGHHAIVEIFSAHSKKTAAAAAPAPAPLKAAPPEPKAEDAWELTAPQCVAHVSSMDALGYKIADVFNFASRERIRIVNNLKTKADNVSTTPFDELSDRRQLEEAYNAYVRLGGMPDDSVLGGKTVSRPSLRPDDKAIPGAKFNPGVGPGAGPKVGK